MGIKEIIKKNKQKTLSEAEIPSVTLAVIKKAVESSLEGKLSEINAQIQAEVKEIIADVLKQALDAKKHFKDITEDEIRKFIANRARIIEIKGDKGEAGKNGINGRDGENGKNGRDGISPIISYERILKEVLGEIGDLKDSPKEIVNKIVNSKEKIPLSSISGIDDKFEIIKNAFKVNQSQRGGAKSGGGMGKPIHQTFSISSATTTVTLTYNIAAGGTAIFAARYQGQVMDIGTHYTVSGKVITLLFTPDDGTNFSISYIRT